MDKKIEIGSLAPDFELKDVFSKSIKLSNFKAKKSVVLVFNRGFA